MQPELYDHQMEIVNLNPDRYLLAHDTGSGKTRTAIEIAKIKREPALIICPKSLKENWARELVKYKMAGSSLIKSKEEFKRDWDILVDFPTVIVDEAHFFANYKSQLSKSLYKYFKKHDTPHRYLLTATPYMSTPWNIYTLARLLGKDLGYRTFEQKFFYQVQMGGRVIPMVRKGIEEDLNAIIKDIGSTIKLEDCFDVPAQTDIVEYFKTTKGQRAGIKQIRDPLHIVYWTKRHQIENGVLKGDEYTSDKEFPCNKIDRIKDLCAANPKIAIICRYNAQIDLLQKVLVSNHDVFTISGSVPDRDKVVQQIEEAENAVVLIQASCAEGYELPSVPLMIFASMDFSYVKYKQMRGRLLRANRLKKNVYIYMLTEGGVDEDVYKCIMDKKDFSFSIYQ